MNILTETQLETNGEPVLQSPRLCWECVAHLKRSVRFREQVQDSYRLLQPMLLMCDKMDLSEFLQTSVCRPGRLTTCFAHSVDISPQGDDAQIMTAEQHDDDGGAEPLPVQVKEEREAEQLQETDAHPRKEVTKYVNTSNNSNSMNEFTQELKNNFTCDYCYNRYSSKRALVRHIATYDIYPHSNKTVPVPCEDCVVVLCSDDQCSECSNGLTLLQPNKQTNIAEKHQSNTLLTREEMHTGNKPYQCAVCQKSFSKIENLRRHINIRAHTGEKPFQCQVCLKSFSRRFTLIRHKVTYW